MHKVRLKYFDTERDLIAAFIKIIKQIQPDVVVGKF